MLGPRGGFRVWRCYSCLGPHLFFALFLSVFVYIARCYQFSFRVLKRQNFRKLFAFSLMDRQLGSSVVYFSILFYFCPFARFDPGVYFPHISSADGDRSICRVIYIEDRGYLPTSRIANCVSKFGVSYRFTRVRNTCLAAPVLKVKVVKLKFSVIRLMGYMYLPSEVGSQPASPCP